MENSARGASAGRTRPATRDDPGQHETTAETDTDYSGFEDRSLRVVLEVDRAGPCVMDSIADEIVDVEVRLDGERCYVDVSMQDRNDECEQVRTKHFSEQICSYCPGAVFSEYGCLPRYREVHERGFIMETCVEDTATVSSLVDDLREVCDRVSLRSLVSTDQEGYEELCAIDLSELTLKQREAIYHAKKLGYYDPDAPVSLEDVANTIGISPSALSQRLTRAEKNVIKQIECDCPNIRKQEREGARAQPIGQSPFASSD